MLVAVGVNVFVAVEATAPAAGELPATGVGVLVGTDAFVGCALVGCTSVGGTSVGAACCTGGSVGLGG